MEVAQGIHRIELESHLARLATYALFGERVVLVDAGFAGASLQINDYLRRHGRSLADVSLCVITHAHADHFGGSAEIKAAAPGTTFCVHREDRAWVEDPEMHTRDNYRWSESFGLSQPEQVIPRIREMLGPAVRVEITLQDGDTIDPGGDWRLRVIHTPGHTRGHIALLDPRSRSLLVGDAIVEPGPLPPAYYDALVYIETQHQIRGLDPRRLLGCHYPVKEGGAALDLLNQAIAHAEECHRVVRDALAGAYAPVHLSSVAQALLDHFHVGESPWRWGWAAYGHLATMERRGEATRREWNGLPAWEVRR